MGILELNLSGIGDDWRDQGWLRDYIKESGVEIEHRKGTLLVSDALTKVLDRIKLTEARARLGLIIC